MMLSYQQLFLAPVAIGLGFVFLNWFPQAALVAYRFARQQYHLRHLPSPPHTLVLGCLPAVASPRSHRAFLEFVDAYGPVFSLRVLWYRMIVLTDPELIQEVFQRSKEFDKHIRFLKTFSEMMSPTHPNLVSASSFDPHWKAVRRGVTPAFSTQHMRAGFPKLALAGRRLVAALHAAAPSGAPVDMDDACMRESLDTIGLVGMDREMGAVASMPGAAAAGIPPGEFSSDDTLAATKDAVAEMSARFREPYRKYKRWRADVRAGAAAYERSHALIAALLRSLRERPPAPQTVAAHLLAVQDPLTGAAPAETLSNPMNALMMAEGVGGP